MSIDNVLETFDKLTTKKFNEHDVNSALIPLLPKDRSNIDEFLKAEIMAFEFAENYQDQKTGWGTYFGPMTVWNNGDGTSTESPSIKLITNEMINYWEHRANKSINPILKSRYSGLVWDFKNKITGTSPTHEICRLYIKSLIDTANGDFDKYEINTFTKLKRALSLAISINDSDIINQLKQTLLAFEDRHSVDDKPGLWGYSFDLLLGNKKVIISETEELKIITELEEKLTRLTTADTENRKIDPWAAEAAVERLAIYYRKKQKNDDVKRVVLELGNAFDKIIGDASAMQASGWLDQLHKLYVKYNLTEEAELILLRIREMGPRVASELKPISHTFDLPTGEIDAYITSMTTGEHKDTIFKIAVQFIPIKENAKEQIFDLSKQAPLIYLFSQQIQDEKGRVIATIGSLENDLEGHVVRHISQNLSFSSLFLRAVLNEAVNNRGLSKADILGFIEKTPIINKNRLEIIDRGLDAYFQNDYLVFIHLIIPQIEEAIRNIVEFTGGNVLKPLKGGGGYHLKTFDEILRDDLINKALGEDYASYFRILFTDQRGWNLRNNVCHGMAPINIFNPQTADRVLHALICLGLVHKK
jgi:hypothetical protein